MIGTQRTGRLPGVVMHATSHEGLLGGRGWKARSLGNH